MTTDEKIRKDIRLEALADAYAAVAVGPAQKADKCREAFVETIEAGYWRPGDLVPTEKEIAAVLPVSLGTVRIALRRLAADGIVQRTRGSGTRIVTPRDPFQEPKHIRFLADDGRTVLPHEIQMISVEETAEQGAWSGFLGAHASYIRIVRHILVGGEIPLYNAFYLDGARFRPLLDIAPETYSRLHLRMILHDRFNCPTLGFRQNVCYVEPPERVAAIVGCPGGLRILMLEVLSHSLRERPLSYQQFYIPPNGRRLNLLSPQ